jgi:hypothetical protein
MRGINITSEPEGCWNKGKGWESEGEIGDRNVNDGKVGVVLEMPVVAAPVDGVVKVFGNPF